MRAFLLTLVFSAPLFAAPPSPSLTVLRSTEVLMDLQNIPAKGIPPKLIADADAVAIIPRVIKAGFIVGGRGGHGIVMLREKNGWSEPTFIDIGGASVGFQAGVSATDLVLVFRKRESLERILDGKGKLTLGADAAVAVGPVGRDASAATDGKLQAEIFSYSRSRGLFAGIALDGAVIMSDATNNARYAKEAKEKHIVNEVAELKLKLAELSVEAKK